MKALLVISLLVILQFNGCSNSDPITTLNNEKSPAQVSELISSGDWSFQIFYVPLPDPNPSLPVPLSNAKVYIEKVGVGIVSDTLITDSNGNVLFNISGGFGNGDYIVHTIHLNKAGDADLGGHKSINYSNSPAGVYGTIICAAIDP